MIGEIEPAASTLAKARSLDPDNPAIKDEAARIETIRTHLKEAEKYISKGDHRSAIFHFERILEKAVHSIPIKLRKAESLCLNGQFSQAHNLATDILRADSM